MSIKEHPPQPHTSKEYGLHVPVLLDATLDLLQPREGERYLDLTAGLGGHAEAFLGITKNYYDSVLVDRDQYAIGKLERFKQLGVSLRNTDFVSAARDLIANNQKFDMIVVDLGVSSPQLDQDERGFSFMNNGPLDMRMDRSQELTASTVVNSYDKDRLVDIITRYGEERRSFAINIADYICKNRPFSSTKELASAIVSLHRGPWSKIHPATRTFQALRVEVNQELAQVEALLPLLPNLLNNKGRVGVISFHSLEDRLVKQYFKEQSSSGFESKLRLLNKKVIDGATEDVNHPRSRSAKLRGAAKK